MHHAGPEIGTNAGAGAARQGFPPGARKGVGTSLARKFGPKQLEALDVNWFYSWGSKHPKANPGVEFVPMIWGRGSVRRNGVETVKLQVPVTQAAELLGFNEPDHPKQANMSASEAIDLWPALEESGLRLGSPAPVQALATG